MGMRLRMKIMLLLNVVSMNNSYGNPDFNPDTTYTDGLFQYVVETDGDDYWCVCEKVLNKALPYLSLPDTVSFEGRVMPVRAIADSAFLRCNAQVIKMPSTVKKIGNYAFGLCIYLKEIYIPDEVCFIGSGAFMYCYRLETVNIPSSLRSIEPLTYCSCLNLKKLIIPEGIEIIKDNAFSYCGIEEIHIPSSVTIIGSEKNNHDVFYGCENIIKMTVDSKNKVFDSRNHCNAIIETSTNMLISGCGTTKIPRTVKRISSGAFGHRDNLEKIFIPRRVNSIADGAFKGCSNLMTIKVSRLNGTFDSRSNCNAIILSERNRLHTGCNTTIIPSDIKAIDDYAFSGLSMDFIVIPDYITEINTGAFQDCTRLKYISLPSSLQYIGPSAFSGCSSLMFVDVPSGVSSIKNNTFKDCNSLKSVKIPYSDIDVDSTAFSGCASLIDVFVNDFVYDYKQ